MTDGHERDYQPIQRAGGPNWCFLCDSPSESDVTYLNFCYYADQLNAEFLCEDHLWDALAEQEQDHRDHPMSFIRLRA